MINRITLSNLKGISASYELGELNLICGPNSSGKSAVLDAVTLALLGYIPRLGKKPGATFQLATAGTNIMSVATNDRSITWKRNAKGVTTVDGLDAECNYPPVLLDINEWLGLTGPARIQYVLDHCGTISGECFEEIDRLLVLNPKVKVDHSKEDTTVYLRKLLDAAKINLRQLQAELETLQGSINRSLLEPSVAIKSPDRELKTLDWQIQAMSAQLNKLKGEQEAVARARADIQKKLDKLGDPKARLEDAEQQLNTAREEQAKRAPQVQQIQTEIAKLVGQIDALKKENGADEHRANQIGTIIKDVDSSNCPCCGQQVDPESLRETLEKESEALAARMSDREVGIAELQSVLTSEKDKEAAAKLSLSKVSGKIHTLELEKTRLAEAIKLVDELTEQQASAKPVDSTAELEQQLKELQDKREPLAKIQREFLAQKGVERERANSLQMRDAKSADVDYAKQLVAAIKSAEEELMGKVVGGLLENANRIIGPVLEQKLVYIDGEFQLESTPLATLSGSEQLVVFAGLQLALSIRTKDRVLTLDELGRMDRRRLSVLFEVLHGLVESGFISQFLGVLPGEHPQLGDRWTIINVGCEE